MKESFFHFKPKKLQQVHPETGISTDFINYNQLSPIISLYNFGGLEAVKKHIKKNPLKPQKYNEIYSEYADAVTKDNSNSIKRLDELVILLSETLQNPDDINEEIFKETINEIGALIYGDKRIAV